METLKRILDYGYYCDLAETNEGNLRIDINKEQFKRVRREEDENDSDEVNELDMFPEMLNEFQYLEFIPDLSEDERFGALTSSCGIYHKESDRLWWYPNYQIHNIWEQLKNNKEVIFTLA